MDSVFSQANISPTQGTELLHALGLDAFEIQKPDVYRKYLEIAKYLERYEDAGMIARTVGRTTPKMEKLDKMLEYVSLRRELDTVRAEKAELPQVGMVKDETPEMLSKRQEIESREVSLLTEIRRYE